MYMHFWDGHKIIFEPKEILLHNCDPYLNMPCCDDRTDDVTFGRYGMFVKHFRTGVYWQGGPASSLPKEFRTQLLLLGVS